MFCRILCEQIYLKSWKQSNLCLFCAVHVRFVEVLQRTSFWQIPLCHLRQLWVFLVPYCELAKPRCTGCRCPGVGNGGLQGWSLTGQNKGLPCAGSRESTRGQSWAQQPIWWCLWENRFKKWLFFFFLPGRKNKDHLKQSGQETSVRTSVRPRRAWKYALKTFIVCPSPATD